MNSCSLDCKSRQLADMLARERKYISNASINIHMGIQDLVVALAENANIDFEKTCLRRTLHREQQFLKLTINHLCELIDHTITYLTGDEVVFINDRESIDDK